MKSIITKTEEKRYYNRYYLLLPIYVGLLFSVIIYFLYNLVLVIFLGTGFELRWGYLLIAFAFGFLEGLSTIYFTYKLNKKKNIYFTNYNQKSKTDIYIPVILDEGFFNHTKGVLVITKDTIEFKVYQMFEKKSKFYVPSKDSSLELLRQENSLVKKILTLTKSTNLLKLKVDNKEFDFVVPCLEDITHRLETHHL